MTPIVLDWCGGQQQHAVGDGRVVRAPGVLRCDAPVSEDIGEDCVPVGRCE